MARVFAAFGPLQIEALLLLLLLPLAVRPPRFVGVGCRVALGALRQVAARRRSCVLAMGLGTIALRLVLLPWLPMPAPAIHDEFSCLLGADTLLHGRLANPAHPLWPHLESFHVISHPFYASKYPIGQAALLALGKLVFGHVWAGVLLGAGLLCAALLWMLQGWVPPLWALLLTLHVAPRIGVSSYWVNGYLGGPLGATGACLLLGVLGRLRRGEARWSQALLLGVGLLLLAHTRPYEGALFATAVVLLLAWEAYRRSGVTRSALWRRILLPLPVAGVLVASTVVAINARVTGQPLVFPYAVYQAQYGVSPLFLFQRAAPEPRYHNPQFHAFYVGWERKGADLMQEPLGWLLAVVVRVLEVWTFWCGPLLTVALLAGRRALCGSRARPLRGLALASFAGHCAVPWFFPHYAVGLLPTLAALQAVCLRHMGVLRRPSAATGRVLAVGLLVAGWVVVGVRVLRPPAGSALPLRAWHSEYPTHFREDVEARLRATPGRHLVLLRYGPAHRVHDEWVYNGADIDDAPIVWARELDARGNRRVTGYYAGRDAWLLEPDVVPPRLTRYPIR